MLIIYILKSLSFVFLLSLSLVLQTEDIKARDTVYIRVNQAGYLTGDEKVAVAFSHSPVKGKFSVHNAATGQQVFQAKVVRSKENGWGTFVDGPVDIGDYSTNKPTMDETADAIYLMAYLERMLMKERWNSNNLNDQNLLDWK